MDTKTLLNLPQEDQEKYYGGTYLKGMFQEIPQYISLIKFIGENVVKYSVAGSSMRADRIDDLGLEFDLPESGMYNSDNGPFFFYRKPERQTKKGLCLHTAVMTMFASLFRGKAPGGVFKTGFNWGCGILNNAFLQWKDPTYEEGLHSIGKRSQIGLALDRNFILTHGLWGKSPTLWFRHVPIGEAEKGRILIYSPLFFQEAVDKFTKEGVKCEARFDVYPEKRNGDFC